MNPAPPVTNIVFDIPEIPQEIRTLKMAQHIAGVALQSCAISCQVLSPRDPEGLCGAVRRVNSFD
jgi:hypothetical protein